MLIYLGLIESEADKERFTALYEQYQNFMFNTANSILHDNYLSEDVVHQAFMKIIDCMDRIQEVNCPRTKNFLGTIVRNTAIDSYNKRKKNSEVEFDEAILPQSSSPGDSTIERELVEHILQLPHPYRDAMELSVIYGYKTPEIASLLSTTPENIRKRLERGRVKLQKRMEEEPYAHAF